MCDITLVKGENMGLFKFFRKKENKGNKEIARVRILFDYESNNIFFYDAKDNLIFWGDSLIPTEWQKDEKFMELNKNLCEAYDSLFAQTATKFDYVGFKDEHKKEEFKKLANEFVEYVIKKCDGKYEISNDYDIESL